jgi:hypothetical protein
MLDRITKRNKVIYLEKTEHQTLPDDAEALLECRTCKLYTKWKAETLRGFVASRCDRHEQN